jgi:hypothetical protein
MEAHMFGHPIALQKYINKRRKSRFLHRLLFIMIAVCKMSASATEDDAAGVGEGLSGAGLHD